MITLGPIDTIFLFGGAKILADTALHIRESGRYALRIYTCRRQLQEPVLSDGTTLGRLLDENKLAYVSTDDINTVPGLVESITPGSLGLGFGEAWSFSREVVQAFGGRLFDLMGIPLPRYRGGAHLSWLIMHGGRSWGCHLQYVDEHTVQAEKDTGEIIKSREYAFPEAARIPQDHFDHAQAQELAFIKEFLEDIAAGRGFDPRPVEEANSLYLPRLNTLRHGLIDWTWTGTQIERFIQAFDAPYAGAGTFLDSRRLFLKDCAPDPSETFHPFSAGLVYRVHGGRAYLATADIGLSVGRVLDEEGRDVLETLRPGDRLWTPADLLEQARSFRAHYSPSGLVRS